MKYSIDICQKIINDLKNKLSDNFEIEESYQETNFKIVISRKEINNSEIFGFEINLSNSFLLDIISIDSNGEIIDFINKECSNQNELMTLIFSVLRKHIDNFQ